MCGISGFFSLDSFPISSFVDSSAIDSFVKHQNHRGPDACNTRAINNGYLVHQRLSIVDHVGGCQPMELFPGVVLIFNGEIYNAPVLRNLLETLGVSFDSDHSDTEVIYKGYLFFGTDIFAKLDGMFAIAIYDAYSDSIHLARDSIGMKPLYYYKSDHLFIFASEQSTLSHIVPLEPNLDPNVLSLYFKFRTTVLESTFYKNVYKLLPGYFLTVSRTNSSLLSSSIQFRTASNKQSGKFTAGNMADLGKVLHSSISSHLISDVPVAVLLSGGVDSSIVAAIASKYGVKDAFCVSTDSNLDESAFAQDVATKFGLNLHILRLSGQNFIDAFYEWTSLNDGPSADPSAIALYCLSSFINSKGFKVVLSGDGADELFGGYHAYTRYLTLRNLSSFLPFSLIKAIVPSDFKSLDYLRSRHTLSLFQGSAHSISDHFPIFTDNQSAFSFFKSFLSSITTHQSLKDFNSIDFAIRLPDDILHRTDKATMAFSIEARLPFLDSDLVDYGLSLPLVCKFGVLGLSRKVLLKRYALSLGIPRSAIYRRKLGFELPLSTWLSTYFSESIIRYLSSKSIPGLNYNVISSFYNQLLAGSEDSQVVLILWHWITLEFWYSTSFNYV